MNLWNAKLQRIDVPAGTDAQGEKRWTAGSSIDVQCVLDEPSFSQRSTLGATLNDLDAMLYVVAARLPSGATLQTGYRVVVQQWDKVNNVAFGAVQTFEILRAEPRAGGTLTHYECALKGI